MVVRRRPLQQCSDSRMKDFMPRCRGAEVATSSFLHTRPDYDLFAQNITLFQVTRPAVDWGGYFITL